MSDTPKLVRYSLGLFKLRKENLPESLKNDKDMHNKLLALLQSKYSNYSWGSMSPQDKFNEINDFLYSFVKDYYTE